MEPAVLLIFCCCQLSVIAFTDVLSLQAYIDRPRVDAEMQCEYLMETVYIQTENITDSVATQTICAEMTTGTQTQQQCEAKQCQTEVIK